MIWTIDEHMGQEYDAVAWCANCEYKESSGETTYAEYLKKVASQSKYQSTKYWRGGILAEIVKTPVAKVLR